MSPPLLPFGGEKAKLEPGRRGEALVQRRARGGTVDLPWACARGCFLGRSRELHEIPGGVGIHVRLWARIWGRRERHLPSCAHRLPGTQWEVFTRSAASRFLELVRGSGVGGVFTEGDE